jgi:hypothetical protein
METCHRHRFGDAREHECDQPRIDFYRRTYHGFVSLPRLPGGSLHRSGGRSVDNRNDMANSVRFWQSCLRERGKGALTSESTLNCLV